MLESLVANVLNRVLGAYVSNLEDNQLNIAIWTGYLGELTLNIPWSNLKNKPVKVFINNVYLLANPKADTEYDPEEEQKKAQQVKQEKLANAELLQSNPSGTSEEDDQKNQSFVNQLVTKIVDNLQISINNIHIRYEDKLSDPEHPFSIGLTLSEFSALSTDENWTPTFIEDETKPIHKLITLGSLAAYWNTDSRSLSGYSQKDSIELFINLISSDKRVPQEHQYILKPVSGTGRVILNKHFDVKTPKTIVTLLFDELGFVLDDEQYRDALLMYRKFRPPKEVTPKQNPRAWLQFAGNCILSEIRERNRKLTWEYFAERRDDRCAYVKLYKDKRLDHLTPAQLEIKLSYEDIRFYRSIAKSQLKKERALIDKIKKERQEKQTVSQPSDGGWFSSWWYGGQETSPSNEGDIVLTDEQRQELYQAIDYDEKAAVIESVDFPKEWIKLSFKTKLKTGSFALKKNPRGSNVEILSLFFDTVSTNFYQRPDSFIAETALGNLRVYDGSTEGTLYKQIVSVKEDSRPDSNNSLDIVKNIDIGEIEHDEALENPFFHLVFEQNPLDNRADNAFSLKMRYLEIIYNHKAIEAVIDFFKPPEQQLESIAALIEAAGDTLEGIKAQTRAGLEYALEEHKTIDVKIDMKAPIIVIPESCTKKDAQVVVLDSGHISVVSNLVDKDTIAEVQAKETKKYNEDDYKQLESLMYDKFTVNLSSTQLLVGQSVDRCLNQIRDPNSNFDFHVIERINMTFFVEMSIVRRASNLTKFRISGHLPLLKANFSDRKYKIIMNIIDTIVPPNEPSTPNKGESNFSNFDKKPLSPKPSRDLNFIREKALKWERLKHRESMAGKFGLIDKFTANLKKADPDPQKPEIILVDMALEHFGLNYTLRPFDMSAVVVLKSLSIEDKISDITSEFKHLAASEGYGNAQAEDSKDLVHVKYTKVKPESPEYMSRFEGIDQSVDIEIVVLQPHVAINTPGISLETPEPPSPQQQSSKIRVKARLNSIRFILNNDGVRLATGLLSRADVAVLLRQNTLRVGARLGNFSLTDDMATKDTPESLRQLLTIQGENLADFRYETFDENAPSFPGYNSSIYLRAGSARVTFLEKPILLLLDFGSKFAQMKGLYDSARSAAIEQAAQLQEKVSKFHFDILVNSPIVILPHNNKDTLVANLGELSAINEFISNENGNGFLTQIKAELQKIRLTSNFEFHNGFTQSLQIIDDVDINFKISYAEHVKGSTRPDMEVIGEMSNVNMSLTQKQYKFLLDLSNSVTTAFSGNGSKSPKKEFDSPDTTSSPSTYPKSLQNIDSPAKEENEKPWISVDLAFKVKQINLEIFSGDGSQVKELGESSLSKFSLNETNIKFQMLTDGSIEAELQLKSATLVDTRHNIKNVYKEILPAVNKNTSQFMVTLSISGNGADKSLTAIATVDSPKVILTLDHLFETRNYFMSAFETRDSEKKLNNQADSSDSSALNPSNSPNSSKSSITSQLSKLPHKQQPSVPSEAMTINYRVNITGAEIILLANPHLASTEAVVLSAHQIVLTQQRVLAISINKIGMFLCRIDKRDLTLLRFIDNFDFAMTLDTSNSKPGQQLSSINIDVGPLVLRVSYRDVLLILSIINKVSELSSQSSSSSEKAEKSLIEAENSETQSLVHGRTFNSNAFSAAKKNTSSTKSRPYASTSRESLKAIFQGTRLILIGDEHNIPMIDATANKFSLDILNWSSQMSVDATISTYMNYFNLTNSHWEPLVEPWMYSLHASKNLNPESMIIDISSQKRLEINITHIFLETMLTTLSIINNEKEAARGAKTPYKLRNRTGYNMHVWAISSDDATNTVLKSMMVMKNMLGIQFDGSNWECIRDIHVDREGEKLYILRPKLNNVSHRLMVDIKLEDNIKVVTFRSVLVVENRTLLTIELLIIDSDKKDVKKVYQIAPGEDCPLPIEAAYHNQFKIRPEGGFGYNWSTENLFWQDFIKRNPLKSISCNSLDDGDDVSFRFQVFARYKKNDPFVKEYPYMAIRLSAPIQFENLLPYKVNFHIYDKTQNQNCLNNHLEKGCIDSLHLIELGHLLLLSIDIQDANYKTSEPAIIASPNKSDYKVDDTITVTDPAGLKLNLRIYYTEIPDSGGAFKFSLYSPYVIINKTGLDMIFKSKSFLQSARIAAGQGSSRKNNIAPYMFSYPNDEIVNRALLKIGDSDWSRPISFEAVGTFLEVVVPSKSEEMHLGVSIQEGQQKYKLTKIITITPRFVLKNNLNEDINIREPGSKEFLTINSKNRAPLHFLKQGDVKQITLCYSRLNPWSAPININELGRVHVKLYRNNDDITLIRTEILLEDATVFVIFNKEEGRWPYRIENYSDVDVVVYQQNASAQSTSTKLYVVASGNSMAYSWDYPALKNKKLVLNINDNERVVNIQEIGSLVPFKYPVNDNKHKILAIEVVADGPTQVLLLTNYKQSESIFRPRAPSITSNTNNEPTSNREAFEVIDVDSVTTISFQIRLVGIGISIINKRMQELAYASMRGLEFKYKDSTLYQSINFVVKWLQESIDNQLYGGLYPIILYPTMIPKDEKETDTHPAFHAALIKAKDESHGVVYIKYFSILLQEMTFEMDEDFLFVLLEFTKIQGLSSHEENETSLLDGALDIPEPKSTEGDNQLYFEVLHIHPMRFNISFVRTERINVENKPPPRNPMTFFINVLTMAIGNINDAPIKVNALAMENMRVSLPVLIDRIRQHYGNAFIYQVHKIVGSADFLGNPVGLFSNLSSGVVDIFYEPYQGFIMSDKPQDLGIGIARGATSFFKKTVYGFSDSVSKITGSIGKGLSAATLDKSYQDRRRISQFRNRPKHALYGVTQGTSSLVSSIKSGFEGLARKPKEGVEKEGAQGFIKGVGKGLVGFVTKPVVGVFDLASNVTEGIRNTTTVFDENDLSPVRLPRFVGRDEALGQSWLKELEDGKYLNDEYVAHLDLNDDQVVMLTRSRIMLIKNKRSKVEWEVSFDDIQTTSIQPTGIFLKIRPNNTHGHFINIVDPSSKSWFERKIEEVINDYNNEKHHY
nr:8535_t:CDS:10 [Entrophospora candida]CAG8514013.1 6898_t:CDS:10 [Entrophospora candida]